LRCEIVNFSGLRFLHNTDDVGRIRHITVMHVKSNARLMGIMNEVIDAFSVEG
jgi:hypothetical protein